MIQTNAGEIDWTETVKGMVVEYSRPDSRSYGLEGGPYDGPRRLMLTGPTRLCVWEGSNGTYRVLGCDPAIASRADCERFGVHGDAGAYGFARLRGGGAVDLRQPENLVVGMRFQSLDPGTEDQRTTFLHSPNCMAHGIAAGHWCFLGLIPALVHPKDVRRLCCGQSRDPGSSIFCALAIGDHDMHEDLATGVRWAANKALFTPFAEAVLGLHVPEHHRQMANAAQDRLGASAKVEPTADGFTITTRTGGFLFAGDGRGLHFHGDAVSASAMPTIRIAGKEWPCTAVRSQSGEWVVRFSVSTAHVRETEETVIHRGVVGLQVGGEWQEGFIVSCDGMNDFSGRVTFDARLVTNPKKTVPMSTFAIAASVASAMGRRFLPEHAAIGFCDFVASLKAWSESPAGLLTARDAAVAKAIADVPEGCDGQRWTHVVHVLAAFHEETVRARGRAQATADMVRHLAAARPVVAAYARLRFVAGYGVKEAFARLPAEVVTTDTAARMCAAYEAGR